MPASRPWRLLVDEAPGDGDWHMALDRAIQLERAAGRSPATLRLYTWKRPTVSLGRFQRVESVDAEVCRAEGIDLVRRFTGGRGVLHDDELTYAVVAATSDGVPSTTSASYRFLCAALVDTYRLLGIQAELTERPRGERSSGACYLHATHADVSVGLRKLSGSAQVWHRGVVMQHGSFVFSRDVDREARVFRLTSEQSGNLRERTVTLGDLAGGAPSLADLSAAVAEAFRRLSGACLEPGVLTREETALALQLATEADANRSRGAVPRASA